MTYNSVQEPDNHYSVVGKNNERTHAKDRISTLFSTFTAGQKSSRVREEKANYSTKKNANFTPWTWGSDGRMVRYPQKGGFADYDSEQECSNEQDLEEQIALVTKLRQELVDKSLTGRKKEYLQSIKSKDRDLEYLRQRLELVRSSQLRESPNGQPTSQEPASVKIVDTEELTPSLERSSTKPSPEETEVVDTEELTPDEERDRLHLERKVERAFYEAGKALQEIRDRKLYRSTHGTFEEYCRDRFGYNRRQPYLLIEAAAIVDNLSEKCDPMDHILPSNERQVRPLTKLDPDQQREAWQKSVESAGGKIPSGRVVKDIVQRIMEKTKVPNPFRVGEVCQIVPKDHPELRGKGGCWGIVTHVGDYSCTVMAWDGEHTVRMDQLKLLEYTDSEYDTMRFVCDRITRLRTCDKLEPAAQGILKQFGELKRPYLTPLEEKLLELLEFEYKI